MAPRQELIRLREGFAQQGEAWLRERLEKLTWPSLQRLAGAAKVQQALGRCRLSKPELLEALFRSIAEGEASEEILTADGLRRLAAEHGEKAPARIRERLRSVRLRPGDGDGVCVQQLAEELGVAFENARKETLIHRLVMVLCPLASPSASADVKYQIWRSLRAVREAGGAADVAGVVAAVPDIFEDADLRKAAIACALDVAVETCRQRHLTCEQQTQLLAQELLRALEHWPDVDSALPREVSSGWEAAVASLKGVTVSGLASSMQHCLLAAVLEDRVDQRAGERLHWIHVPSVVLRFIAFLVCACEFGMQRLVASR